jgi:hypothetical protein
MYVTCPWHGWEYRNRKAPPGYEDQQSVYEIKIEDDSILISEEPIVKSKTATHDLSALEDLIQLKYQTTGTSLNILGISTTNMNDNLARFSTSDALEKYASKNMTQKQKYLSYGN